LHSLAQIVPRQSRGLSKSVMPNPLSPIRRICPAIVIAAALLALGVDVASACPTCKEGVAQNDPHYQSMAAGYYYSILFMMSMPFIIVTTFGTFAYRSVKKAQAQRAAQRSEEVAAG
jgi:uncharacterized membrane protein